MPNNEFAFKEVVNLYLYHTTQGGRIITMAQKIYINFSL
jgi:hypothetical protein